MTRGYKVFNPDWTCRGKQYTCPGIFEEDTKPDVCNTGMHFCERLVDCFNYYSSANETYHFAEVVAHGEVSAGDDKCCTNKLEIVREIPWSDVTQIVNTGNGCTGIRNSGNCNSGNWNSGDRNSGDWNTTFGASGCFNTSEQPITMFNKTSEWTLRDWWNSEAQSYMCEIPRNVVEWICSDSMTDEEKAAHPEHETTGGYLKVLDKGDCAQIWWDGLEEHKKSVIMSLPNFDARIFKECTGIDVSKAKEAE